MKMLYIDWTITAYYLGIAATGDYNYRRKLCQFETISTVTIPVK
jgi:hypothetical protein